MSPAMLRMQQPTCTNIRIRSTADAHKIFHAVQKGKLHMVTRRLDSDERSALCSGCVYAWEERSPATEITGLGIERFTEGRRWSPSRVRDEFLFYYEKYSPPDSGQPSGSEKPQAPRDWDPLVKQTYSVWVDTEKGKRKWHLTAYFTQLTVDNLGTIDDIVGVGDLSVPDGTFKSTRVTKSRGKADEPARNAESTTRDTASTSTTRTYAPFPAPYAPSMSPQHAAGPMYESYATVFSHSRSSEHPQYAVTPITRHVPLPTRTPYQNGNRIVDYQQESQYSPSPRVIASSLPASSFVVPSQYPSRLSYTPAPPAEANYSISSPLSPTQPASPWYDSRPDYVDQSQQQGYPAPIPVRAANPSTYPLHYNLISALHASDPSSALVSPVPASLHESYPFDYYSRGTTAYSSYGSDDGAASPTPSSASSGRSGEFAHQGMTQAQRDLAPLHSLKRHHPYRRDPEDDKTLRLLDPRPVPSAP